MTDTTESEAPAANVIEALRRVMRDLPGIKKALDSQQGYKYRGIEQVTVEAQPLFAHHGVIFIPAVDSYEIVDITVNGKPWTDTRLMVRYTVYGPAGVDDHIVCGPLLGIGRDNSDKGANKAMTQAYKYAFLQAFTIADAKDDGDAASHEADAPRTAPPVDPARKARSDFGDRVRASARREAFKAWVAEQGYPDVPAKYDDVQLEKATEWLDFAESEAEHDARTAPDASESHDTPPEPPSAPHAAPESSEPAEALDPEAERAALAADYVKGLGNVELLVEFGKRNVTAPRTIREQRAMLADVLFEDASWEPTP